MDAVQERKLSAALDRLVKTHADKVRRDGWKQRAESMEKLIADKQKLAVLKAQKGADFDRTAIERVTGLKLEELFRDAGTPNECVRILQRTTMCEDQHGNRYTMADWFRHHRLAHDDSLLIRGLEYAYGQGLYPTFESFIPVQQIIDSNSLPRPNLTHNTLYGANPHWAGYQCYGNASSLFFQAYSKGDLAGALLVLMTSALNYTDGCVARWMYDGIRRGDWDNYRFSLDSPLTYGQMCNGHYGNVQAAPQGEPPLDGTAQPDIVPVDRGGLTVAERVARAVAAARNIHG